MEVLGETIENKVEKYFKAGKAAEALGRWMPCNDELLKLIASYIQEKKLDAIVDRRKVGTFGTTSIGNLANWDTAVAADADLVQEAQDGTSSRKF